jgi:hypothetical protein
MPRAPRRWLSGRKDTDGLARKLEELKKSDDQAGQTQIKPIEEEMTRIRQKIEAYLQAQKTDEDQGGKI